MPLIIDEISDAAKVKQSDSLILKDLKIKMSPLWYSQALHPTRPKQLDTPIVSIEDEVEILKNALQEIWTLNEHAAEFLLLLEINLTEQCILWHEQEKKTSCKKDLCSWQMDL